MKPLTDKLTSEQRDAIKLEAITHWFTTKGLYQEFIPFLNENTEEEALNIRTMTPLEHQWMDFKKILCELVVFQEDYEENTKDKCPGNQYYSDKLMAIVDRAKKAINAQPESESLSLEGIVKILEDNEDDYCGLECIVAYQHEKIAEQILNAQESEDWEKWMEAHPDGVLVARDYFKRLQSRPTDKEIAKRMIEEYHIPELWDVFTDDEITTIKKYVDGLFQFFDDNWLDKEVSSESNKETGRS